MGEVPHNPCMREEPVSPKCGGGEGFGFPRSFRLTHDREFQSVFAARMRKTAGPLALFTKHNAESHPRLGLSIGRGVGGAVTRNRLKRLLREAFRLNSRSMPRLDGCSYDMIVSARPHALLTLTEYEILLLELARASHAEHVRRAERAHQAPRPPAP